MKLSIIIPTLNEAATIVATLTPLQPLLAQGHEIILADGGSRDETLQLSSPLVTRQVHTTRGRARQMNAGAAAAQGEVLLFLHADTLLPDRATALIAQGLERGRWGRFDVRLSGETGLLRLVERMMNLRSRYSGIATGDQAIFVTRSLFEQLRGFPELPLMEDIALSRRLKRHGRPVCLRARVVTSSRRWEEYGIVRTILLMWMLRLAYFLGVSPRHLVKLY